ncbi:MAG: DUF6599 family protein [Ignavibacteriaceae bacterium]
MIRRFVILTFLIFPSFLLGQDFSRIPDCKVIRSAEFNGEGLWGHINGGADLYLEYGFTKLTFHELKIENFMFRFEDYEMTDESAAFGIFSLSRFKCVKTPLLPIENCMSKYQTQLLLGKHYISVVNTSGTEKEQLLNLELAKLMPEKGDSSFFSIPSLFYNKLFSEYIGNLKFFRGILGIQNGAPGLIEYFEKYENYSVYHLPINLSESYINISLINFNNGLVPDDFPVKYGFDKAESGNNFQYRVKISASGFVLVEYTDPAQIDEMELIKSILVCVESLQEP